jgi:hypothetical protein
MIRDRLASSEHQRAYMEDIHEQVWIGYVRKEMDTLSGVRAYMVKMYLQVEMYRYNL